MNDADADADDRLCVVFFTVFHHCLFVFCLFHYLLVASKAIITASLYFTTFVVIALCSTLRPLIDSSLFNMCSFFIIHSQLELDVLDGSSC